MLLMDPQKSDPMMPGTLASRKAVDFAVVVHCVELVQIAFCCAVPTLDRQTTIMKGTNGRNPAIGFAMFFILGLSSLNSRSWL